MVVGWWSTRTSASNSQHAWGLTCLSTITIPFLICDRLIWSEKLKWLNCNLVIQSSSRHVTAMSTKTSLKKWIRAASNFIALISSRLIRQMLAIRKDCIKVHVKKKNCFSVFPSLTKRENRYFHVVVVQRRQINVQKSVIDWLILIDFANLNP